MTSHAGDGLFPFDGPDRRRVGSQHGLRGVAVQAFAERVIIRRRAEVRIVVRVGVIGSHPLLVNVDVAFPTILGLWERVAHVGEVLERRAARQTDSQHRCRGSQRSSEPVVALRAS